MPSMTGLWNSRNCWRNNRVLRVGLTLALILSTIGVGCNSRSSATLNPDGTGGNPNVSANAGYEIVKAYPHDPKAYTQGLLFAGGNLIESTGRVGQSTLRRVELQTGKVLAQVDVPPPYFAEGLTLLNGKLYQLTWQHGVGFIYDANTFGKLGEFKYSGEGWGLTTDGQRLILSDGTNRLRFFDPQEFKLSKSIEVFDRGRPVLELNELEFIKGEIYANIWHNQKIARIDPATGHINGWVDLTGLSNWSEASDEEAVLNGIAYDAGSDRLFVTGKLWGKLFEIRLRQN
jgi:glutamine cyclotransferase